MPVNKLDHVALWVAERDPIADLVTAHLGMHVIDRTETFTLLGSNARRGKLTLFAAPGPRGPGPLKHIAWRVSDIVEAESQLPSELELERPTEGEVYFDVAEGLRLGLVEAPTDVEYDLDHVALLSPDPAATADAWLALGFEPAEPTVGGVTRVEAGGAFVELHQGEGGEPEQPLLNHLAVLVDSAEEWRGEAEGAGAEVADVVDAPNTFAVFVWGPDRVKLEYVEHKPSFSLT